jgi:hypothetical protein
MRLHLPQPPHRSRVIEFAVGGWFGRRMHRAGWGALTIPFPFVQVIAYWMAAGQTTPRPGLRVHEWVHVAQNERDLFWLMSWVRYLWQLGRVLRWRNLPRRPKTAMLEAYREHPAEVAAYAVQEAAESPGEGRGLPEWAREVPG